MDEVKNALALPPLDGRSYVIEDAARILTPALAIYLDVVDSNIEFTLDLLDRDASGWRPHIKTAKLELIMRRYLEHGVSNFKCSTSLELATACGIGVPDVLVAYPVVGANAKRVSQLADQFTRTRVSALVESPSQVEAWGGSRVGLFIDVNPGMNRTGVEQEHSEEILAVARAIENSGQEFRGLHYYDGHLGKFELKRRQRVAHQGYDRLMEIAAELEGAGMGVDEVITAGTPAFPCTLSYPRFKSASFIHRASPGTVVYGDCTSLEQLPVDWGYRPAAVVVSTVVSHPSPGRLTCDAGHKAVSADAGSPTCAVIGRPDLIPAKPSEEHLPIDTQGNLPPPAVGETLYLVPRHVCPTINNFDHALVVKEGRVSIVARVTARGREAPLPN